MNNNQSRNNKEHLSKSAIQKHLMETGHTMDWDDAKLLWSASNPRKLLIKESLVIKAHDLLLNRTTHSLPLYVFPNGIDKSHLPRFGLDI